MRRKVTLFYKARIFREPISASLFPTATALRQRPVSSGPASRGPARKAAILLFVLGGLGAAMGLCMGSITWLVPVQQLEMFVEQLKGVGVVAPPGISPAQFVRIFYTTGGVMAAAVGCVLIASPFLSGGRAERAS